MADQITVAGVLGADEGAPIPVADALKLAHLCNTLVVLLEQDGDADMTAALLRTCTDMITRQHLMLQQANLLPRIDCQPTGSTH